MSRKGRVRLRREVGAGTRPPAACSTCVKDLSNQARIATRANKRPTVVEASAPVAISEVESLKPDRPARAKKSTHASDTSDADIRRRIAAPECQR